MTNNLLTKTLAFSLLTVSACGGSSGSGKTSYAIENPPTSAVAGDTLLVNVEETQSDGTVVALPAGTTVTWNVPTVSILAPESTADSPLPATGATPTVFFVTNPSRSDIASTIANRLFVRDAGTSGGSVTVTGTIAGANPGTVSFTLAVSATPAGNVANGKAQYATACSPCHGDTGHGTVANADGSFTIEGTNYAFPAPGLNAEDGNAGSDPAWNGAVFAQAARGEFDDGGVAQRLPMPSWLSDTATVSGKVLATQDLADIYAFMQTQTQ